LRKSATPRARAIWEFVLRHSRGNLADWRKIRQEGRKRNGGRSSTASFSGHRTRAKIKKKKIAGSLCNRSERGPKSLTWRDRIFRRGRKGNRKEKERGKQGLRFTALPIGWGGGTQRSKITRFSVQSPEGPLLEIGLRQSIFCQRRSGGGKMKTN